MKNCLPVTPVKQTGHNCKITAIAAIDQYYAQQLGFLPIPLHKNKSSPVSIREIAKKNGSVQGELLEVQRIQQIFADIGYETELVDFKSNPALFRETIINNIQSGHLIVAFFAVDRQTAEPTTRYENNEHAAIINGIEEDTGVMEIVHWDKRRKTSVDEFYRSSMALLDERAPEYYCHIKWINKVKKYDLVNSHFAAYPGVKKSIVPQANTGFRGKLVVVKKPELKNMLGIRNQFFKETTQKQRLNELFNALNSKLDKLIEKGQHDSRYRVVGQSALTLRWALEDVRQKHLTGGIGTPQALYMFCKQCVEQVKPEFKNHRGWHQLHAIFRGFLGVLAALTIIPAGIVALTGHGYQQTFFETPETNSARELVRFEKQLKKWSL